MTLYENLSDKRDLDEICWYCGSHGLKNGLQKHHCYLGNEGGPEFRDADWNIAPACYECHMEAIHGRDIGKIEKGKIIRDFYREVADRRRNGDQVSHKMLEELRSKYSLSKLRDV